MPAVPFANKYRPHTLAEVVGQDVVVKILTNSLLKTDFIMPIYLKAN